MTDPFYSSARWKKARAQAKARDGYACVVCGSPGPPLDVDHVISWRIRADLAYDLANLVTLCRLHHNRKTHGRKRKPRRRNSQRW